MAEITLLAFKSYLWIGQMSLADQCKFGQYALEVYTQIGREAEVFHEGSESDAFWKALGGKTEYPKTSSKPPLSTKSGSKLYKYEENSVEEITNFQKEVCLNFEVSFKIKVHIF